MAKKFESPPLKDWVRYDEAEAETRVTAPSENPNSLSATTTASLLGTADRVLTKLGAKGTNTPRWTQKTLVHLRGRLGRRSAGRPVGPAYDISDLLDEITELMDSEGIKRFTAARRVVQKARADRRITVSTSDKNLADRLAKEHKKKFG